MAGLLVGLIVTTLFGCAANHAVENAYISAEQYPMAQRPFYYQQLYDSGRLDKKQYGELMQTWEKMNAAPQSQEITFARMTPTERATAWQRETASPSTTPPTWTTQNAPPAAVPPVSPAAPVAP